MSTHYNVEDFKKPSGIPPLRAAPFQPDDFDEARCAWIKGLWHSQDDLLRSRDRQVEENVRMLLGQQWIAWSEMQQRYVNLSEHMGDDEKRWRHMPVLNRLFLWYVLLHARMTENPPVLSWQPGPDRMDALLAEAMDPLFKHLWYDVEMLEVLDRLTSWLIPSGRAYLKSRIDPMKGEPIPTMGPALLQLLGGDGNAILGPDGMPIQREVDNVPYAPNGDGEFVPQAELRQGESEDDYSVQPTGDPYAMYQGGLELDVVTCLEARGEWGEHTPWHRKQWHIHRSLLTPLQAWESLGVEIEPDIRGDQAEGAGILWRLLHGSGLFGAADTKRESTEPGTEFCSIYECWQRPGRFPGTERTKESPGGRLITVTGGGKVIRDGVRPAKFRYTSPIRCFDMVNLPGRPQGTSPQEFLNGPVRTRNRLHGQIVGHATLAANPIRIIDEASGLKAGDVGGHPGEEVVVNRNRSTSKAPPVEFIRTAELGRDVYEAADRLGAEIDQIGHIAGQEGRAPTKDSSGELVKELRFNSDRPIAATMKRMVIELGRMAEDWVALAPIIYDEKTLLSIVGEDEIARTITILPEMFTEGNVNVKPEIESMLPEGRGERQERMLFLWQKGAWGPPDSPQAINQFLELARFPHMSRATRPGGVDRSTASQNIGKILLGTPAAQIAVFPWYEHGVHLEVLELFMKSPEYLRIEPQVQGEFVEFWTMLRAAAAEKMLMDSQAAVAFESAAMGQRAASMPQPTGGDDPGGAQPTGNEQPDRGPTQDLPRTRDAVA